MALKPAANSAASVHPDNWFLTRIQFTHGFGLLAGAAYRMASCVTGGSFGNGAPVCLQNRPLAGKPLPPVNDHVGVQRIEFHEKRVPPCFLRADQGRPAAAEQVQNIFTGLGRIMGA